MNFLLQENPTHDEIKDHLVYLKKWSAENLPKSVLDKNFQSFSNEDYSIIVFFSLEKVKVMFLSYKEAENAECCGCDFLFYEIFIYTYQMNYKYINPLLVFDDTILTQAPRIDVVLYNNKITHKKFMENFQNSELIQQKQKEMIRNKIQNV